MKQMMPRINLASIINNWIESNKSWIELIKKFNNLNRENLKIKIK